MLRDDLEGWGREDGREAQEGAHMRTCVCIWLIRFVVQQKLTQYWEAIILQKRLKSKEDKDHRRITLQRGTTWRFQCIFK